MVATIPTVSRVRPHRVHSALLGRGVLTPPAFTAVLDPRLDFFAGTVAGAYIPSRRMLANTSGTHPEPFRNGRFGSWATF